MCFSRTKPGDFIFILLSHRLPWRVHQAPWVALILRLRLQVERFQSSVLQVLIVLRTLRGSQVTSPLDISTHGAPHVEALKVVLQHLPPPGFHREPPNLVGLCPVLPCLRASSLTESLHRGKGGTTVKADCKSKDAWRAFISMSFCT